MAPDPDAIADCVLATFDSLPEKRKPRPRTHGGREWVPLAGIVLSQGGTLSCVSLGTGMKCLPQNKLALAKGNVLHDWHAEVVAIRALNRYLLDECVRISTPPYPASNILERSPQNDITSHRFTIRDNVSLHMYCSEAPCGDASMELTMALQEDATPWTSAPPTLTSTISSPSSDSPTTETNDNATLRGRSNFSHLGVVRAKPSRPDAPPTLSKSCTDKLALKQSLSLLSSTVSLLINPKNAYLDSLILPASQFVPSACERAFSASGRLKDVLSVNPQENWKGGYKFQPFTVKTTTREFAWSRRGLAAPEKAIASNLSAVWTPTWQETLIGGVLQGRKQFDTRGASRISRRAIWTECLAIAAIIGSTALSATLNSSSRKGQRTYGDVKACVERERVKNDMRAVLKGWVRNEGDEDWSLSESFTTTM